MQVDWWLADGGSVGSRLLTDGGGSIKRKFPSVDAPIGAFKLGFVTGPTEFTSSLLRDRVGRPEMSDTRAAARRRADGSARAFAWFREGSVGLAQDAKPASGSGFNAEPRSARQVPTGSLARSGTELRQQRSRRQSPELGRRRKPGSSDRFHHLPRQSCKKGRSLRPPLQQPCLRDSRLMRSR